MTLTQRQDEFIALFNSLPSWQDKFQYLIDLGNELPSESDHLKYPQFQIRNCTSKTYFHAYVSNDLLKIEGWSNASIPSGLIAMLKQIFEGISISELQTTNIYFHKETALSDHLTIQRKQSLNEMIEHILKN